MNKTLLIAGQIYWQSLRRSVLYYFLLELPSMLILIIVGVAAIWPLFVFTESRPVGVVNQAGSLTPLDAWQATRPDLREIALVSYASEAEARQAYEAGTLRAYYVIPPDYVATGAVREVTPGVEMRGESVRTKMQAYLTEGLLEATPPEGRARIMQGITLLHRPLTRAQGEQNLQQTFQWIVVGCVLALFYYITLVHSSEAAYALVDEQTHNTLEIMLTTVKAEQLVTGKVAGVMGVGLTHVIVFTLGGGSVLALVLLALARLGIVITLDPIGRALALCVALCLPAYIMNVTGYVVITAATDMIRRNVRLVREALMLGNLISAPLAAFAAFTPNHPLTVALSLWPPTAPLVMSARYVQVQVPAWQVALSVGLIWSLMAFNLIFGARLYRASVLMDSQQNRLRSLWLALGGR